MKKLVPFLTIPLVMLVASVNTNSGQVIMRSETENYKNLAFSSCLHKVYPSFEKSMKDGSSSGFFQISRMDLDELEELYKLAEKYAGIEYPSATRSNLGIMKCLDFYNSKELDVVVTRMLSE